MLRALPASLSPPLANAESCKIERETGEEGETVTVTAQHGVGVAGDAAFVLLAS